MPLTRLRSSGLAPDLTLGNVVVSGTLSSAAGGDYVTNVTVSAGPKITTVQVLDSSYTVLDDTAVDIAGGNILITGSGFSSGCQVLIGTTPATSTTFISATQVRAQLPATSAGTYIVYLVNSDGGVAIRINGVTFSSTPTWVTGSTLENQTVDLAISIQLNATDATTYSVAAGSTLPTGLTLSSGGLLSGTVTGITDDTTYNFTVVATDAELQDSPRAFSVTITAGDPLSMYNVLLLNADGVSDTAQNNTFVDSSTNNFAITRVGNTTQGSFTPYGGEWSNYFDNTGDALSVPASSSLSLGSEAFTLEAWIYPLSFGTDPIFESRSSSNSAAGYAFLIRSSGNLSVYTNNSFVGDSSTAISLNTWNHVALVRSGTGSNQTSFFINGIESGKITLSNNFTDASTNVTRIGGSTSAGENFHGYISNARIVKGTAVYTNNFTPSTVPLTTIANTSLLTCQSNRFRDASANNFALSRTGDVRVTKFSPFRPATAYSAATLGGSAYFDGTEDRLSSSGVSIGTGDVTVEFWFYPTDGALVYRTLIDTRSTISTNTGWYVGQYGLKIEVYGNGLKGSSADNAFTVNQWIHFAIVRTSGTCQIYINGTASGTSFAYADSFTSTSRYVGAQSNGNTPYIGYISNIREVTSSLYTGNFTPPTIPLTAVTNTSLLLNFANVGITDSSMNNIIETVGNARVSTAVKKYGTGSIYFDGTGDSLITPYDINYQLDTGNFTIELWINASASGSYTQIVGTLNTGTENGTWRIGNRFNSNNQVYFARGYGTGFQEVVYNTNVNDGNWHHIACVRISGTISMYIDGILQSPSSGSAAISGTCSSTLPLRLGHNPRDNVFLTGYIDDLRITKGVARYTTNFTPPSKLPIK